MSHTSCTSYTSRLTHHGVIEIAYDMFFIGNTFVEWWLVSCSFHATLCNFFNNYENSMEIIWKENPAIKICEWMCWSSNLVSLDRVCMWPAQSNKKTSSRVCLHITMMARSRPTPTINYLIFPYFLKDIISRLRYCSKGDPNYLLNYLLNNQ